MKIIFLLIAVIGFVTQSISQSYYQRDIENWNSHNLKGEVKSISQTTIGGMFSGSSKVWNFNNTGGVTIHESFSKKGTKQERSSYEITYSEDGFPFLKASNGKENYFLFYDDGDLAVVINSYDYYNFEYEGKINTGVKVYDADSVMTSEVKWEYFNGFPYREEVYKNDTLSAFTDFTYDTNGNEIKAVYKTWSVTYEYDQFGNKTKQVYYKEDGSVNERLSYDYVDYTYDDQNNWLSRTRFKEGGEPIIYKREIEYYN